MASGGRILQVHDSWVLAALVPLVALFPRAETLIVVQVLAVACAAIPLVLFAREIGLDDGSGKPARHRVSAVAVGAGARATTTFRRTSSSRCSHCGALSSFAQAIVLADAASPRSC